MKSQQFIVSRITLIGILALLVGSGQAQAPGTQQVTMPQAAVGNAFTYQGSLSDGGKPANGEYDFRFILYNALTDGSQVGSIVATDDVTVTNGLFTVALDFGTVFDGTGLWLEASVRPGSSTGDYIILSPRQEITPAPYALSLKPGAYIQGDTTSATLGGSGAGVYGEASLFGGAGIHGLASYTGNECAIMPSLYENSGGYFESKAVGCGYGVYAKGNIGSYSVGAEEGSHSEGDEIGSRSEGGGTGSYSTGGNIGSYSAGDNIGSIGAGKIGVRGDSFVSDGYGGLFQNTAGGVDVAAMGSGIIKSTADTQIAVSPLSPITYIDSDWQDIYSYPNGEGYTIFRAVDVIGTRIVFLPVSFPSKIFGVPQKLESIKVCYFVVNADSYIDTAGVNYTTDFGVSTTLLIDTTDRKSTTWTCYTYSDTTPDLIGGSMFVRFHLNYAGTGGSHDIVIGNVTLTLTEE